MKGEHETFKESAGISIFNRPESFSLETTDKKDMFIHSKGNSQSLLSMKVLDKYEAAVPVVE